MRSAQSWKMTKMCLFCTVIFSKEKLFMKLKWKYILRTCVCVCVQSECRRHSVCFSAFSVQRGLSAGSGRSWSGRAQHQTELWVHWGSDGTECRTWVEHQQVHTQTQLVFLWLIIMINFRNWKEVPSAVTAIIFLSNILHSFFLIFLILFNTCFMEIKIAVYFRMWTS